MKNLKVINMEVFALLKQVNKKQAFQNAEKNREYLKNIGVQENEKYRLNSHYEVYFYGSHRSLSAFVYYNGRCINTTNFIKNVERVV